MKFYIKIFICLLGIILQSAIALAQTGFNPEYLGNAAGVKGAGFCLKTFLSYFYQNPISAHDIEMAFEPQVFIPGFSGDIHKDQIQFIAHLPVGFRSQQPAGISRDSVVGIGSLAINIEHFWHIIDTKDLEMWLDHAISSGYPTATEHRGVRIGGNSFVVGAFQEFFLRYKSYLFSIMPVFIDWSFKDNETNQRAGFSMNVLNGSIGYQIFPNFAAGINFGLLLGNLAGSEDANGVKLPVSARAYAGPAFNISFNDNLDLQIGGIFDVYTRQNTRGQGIFMALWHHF
ncbi:MAG: hypothetical protein ABH859_03265 [Pseudomonadota bacterium]